MHYVQVYKNLLRVLGGIFKWLLSNYVGFKYKLIPSVGRWKSVCEMCLPLTLQ